MAELINLRRVRKARGRSEAQRRAAENRARFGEATPVRKARKSEHARAEREHEGKQIDDGR